MKTLTARLALLGLLAAGTLLISGCTDRAAPTFCDDGQDGPCPEACSAGAVDEDQDGKVDEGFEGLCCDVVGGLETRPGERVGVCTRSRRCGSTHRWLQWEDDPPPSEMCNGRDDDCDGVVDEDYGIGAACVASNPAGTCETEGVWACDGPAATRCVVDFSDSAGSDDGDCDGVDDDCDGVLDEDPPCNGCPYEVLGGAVPEDMACIPPGTFEMGASAAELADRLADGDESPRHEVSLSEPFLIDRWETSVDRWMSTLGGGNPSNRGGCIGPCPVERVSYFDALVYANARSIQEGLPQCYQLDRCEGDPSDGCAEGEDGCPGGFRCAHIAIEPDCLGFRLPTEAEWEYAARGGVASARWTDEAPPSMEDVELAVCGAGPTRAVRSGVQNAYGVGDMLGNVSEWVHDRYFEGYPVEPGGHRPPGDWQNTAMSPRAGDDEISSELDAQRVVRGGSWKALDVSMCRSASRAGLSPVARGEWLGVRLVRRLRLPASRR